MLCAILKNFKLGIQVWEFHTTLGLITDTQRTIRNNSHTMDYNTRHVEWWPNDNI